MMYSDLDTCMEINVREGLAAFLAASYQAAEDRHTRRHATSDPLPADRAVLPETTESVPPNLDFGVISIGASNGGSGPPPQNFHRGSGGRDPSVYDALF